MTLFVDYRDNNDREGPLLPVLQRYIVPASEVEETALSFCDVAFDGIGPKDSIVRHGIEIKHVSDLLQCMEDGRFSAVDGQLPGIARDYDVYWLLIEDDLKPEPISGILMKKIRSGKRAKQRRARRSIRPTSNDSRLISEQSGGRWVPAMFGPNRTVKYSTPMKWMIEMAVIAGVKVWRTKSRDETAQWIVANYQEWQKPWEEHKALRTFNMAHVNPKMMYLNSDVLKLARMIATYDGIGFERAIVLARKFKSREEFNNASEEDYVVRDTFTVAGAEKTVSVGKKLAASIKEQMGRRRNR